MCVVYTCSLSRSRTILRQCSAGKLYFSRASCALFIRAHQNHRFSRHHSITYYNSTVQYHVETRYAAYISES